MNDMFENKGKLIAIFCVVILLLTLGAVFWAYKTIDTGIDLEDLPEPEVIVAPVEEPEEEPEPEFRLPDTMRGIVITPGLDFYTDRGNTAEDIEAQLDDVFENVKKYEFNTVIIDTKLETDVLYHTPDSDPVTLESEPDLDLYELALSKAAENNLFVYSLVDISYFRGELDSLFTTKNYDALAEKSELYLNLQAFANKYQPDGILIDRYFNFLTNEEKEEYKDVNDELTLEEYLVQASELEIKVAKRGVQSEQPQVQLGILAPSVWENESEDPNGSDTEAETTALEDLNVDTYGIITNDIVDFVVVKTENKIGDEKVDFENVVNWWDNVADETEAPIYIMSAASQVNATDNTYGDYELARQAELVDKKSSLEGSIFDSLFYLNKNEAATEILMKYFIDGESPDEPAEEEKPTEVVPAPTPVTQKPVAPTTPTPPPAQKETIALNTSTLALRVGESKALTAKIEPSSVNQEATWASSDRNIAKVDGSGNVTAVKKGSATVSATSAGGKVATCTVTVADVPTSTGVSVEEVSISNATLSVAKGSSQQLSVEIRPDAATNKTVTWGSSDDKIATVDTSGKVTGVAVGETTITVKSVDGQKTATCKVTVVDNDNVGPSETDQASLEKVTDITISANSSNMYINSNMTLVLKDQNGKVLSNSLFKWETSDKAILRVDSAGIVRSKSEDGSASISAYHEKYDLYATYKITVSKDKVKVTDIKLEPSTVSVAVGKTTSVKAVLTPSNATLSDLSWSVSNTSIASVDSTGTVTGKKEGFTTLIARSSSGKVQTTARIEVTEKIAVYDVYLQDVDFEMFVGDTDSLTAVVDPSGTEAALIWTSSSPAVLEVDSKGNLKAKKAGTATITVKVSGNEKLYDDITITVVD